MKSAFYVGAIDGEGLRYMMSIFTVPQWQKRNVIELGIWVSLYLALAVPMALGQSNGVGFFQQPQGHSLWAPLLLGGAVNFWIIYLHAYRAMPHLLVRGSRLKYIPYRHRCGWGLFSRAYSLSARHCRDD